MWKRVAGKARRRDSSSGSILGASAWLAMALAYLPAIRYFGLNPAWALTLPIAGILYAAMTLDSAVRGRLVSKPGR